MKKTIAAVLFLLFSASTFTFAQDVITLKDGTDVKAKVIEVGESTIKYKKADNPDGPAYTIATAEIVMVTYENGNRDMFTSTVDNKKLNTDSPAENIKPKMAYKDYKDLYNHKLYQKEAMDQYNPIVSGICSAIIPGLGQIIDGQVGRGLVFFGSAVVLASTGCAMELNSSKNTGLAWGALFLYGGLIAVDIIGVCDACKVAKIKNMYNQDLRKLQASRPDIKLSPSLAYVPVGGGIMSPTAGLSLQITF